MAKVSLHDSIEHLPRWFDLGLSADVTQFVSALTNLNGRAVAVVGSGASYSSAVLIARCIERYLRVPARSCPPFEYAASADAYPAAILVSARGSNEDILEAQEVALTREVDPLVLITTEVASPLVMRSADYPPRTVLSVPRDPLQIVDGFLGTISLVAIWAMIVRSMRLISGTRDQTPNGWMRESIDNARAEMRRLSRQLKEVSSRRHTVALGTGWATPVVVDFESKMVEGGLGWIEVAEAKNFTHGRYINSYRNLDDTAIIVFSTRDERNLANAITLSYGRQLLVLHIVSKYDGPLASLDLFIHALLLVDEMSSFRGIDISRPVVPEEARRMFRGLGIYSGTFQDTNVRELVDVVALRKRAVALAQFGQEMDHLVPTSVVRAAYGRMLDTPFRGLVCDFDGTLVAFSSHSDEPEPDIVDRLVSLLVSGVQVAIVTGRGRSAMRNLRACLDSQLHSKVFCFLYNGAACYRLDHDEPEWVITLPDVDAIAASLAEVPTNLDISKIDVSPLRCQITIHLADEIGRSREVELIAAVSTAVPKHVTVRSSGRFIDIFPDHVSKRRALEVFSAQLRTGSDRAEVLAIGDCGDHFGNDYELLQHPFAISVDRFDWSPGRCFPSIGVLKGISGPVSTYQILRDIEIRDGDFRLLRRGL
jgi:hydroxymethylpyrimidine pyrophosphatase-like HAD family hydrolase/fructoselysine-6-P-deglycase FrlB-like protein